ncbi:MAG: thiamine pyrophosphate-dependent enzyme [Pseudomonadota bacterium]
MKGLAKAATSAVNRAEILDANFVRFVELWDDEPGDSPDPARRVHADISLTGNELLELFRAQLLSRHIDLVAREMRARNEGFYTIGSSGHENNAVLGHLTRTTDPAFLHYRSGGFMMARGAKSEDRDVAYDTALSLAASREDPISGGRHKVWGSPDLWVLPQTSTIASHPPKAVGCALAIEQSKRLQLPTPVPRDSIVICSFGDASSNHSTAQGAFNAAQWTAYQQLPAPVLFVCEDNGLGISVRTPGGWVASNFQNRPGLHYMACDGLDVLDTWRATEKAIDLCRTRRVPVFLHMQLVRLMGHAGTDAETDYRTLEDVEGTEASDPLLITAETVMDAGLMTSAQVLDLYESTRERARTAATKAAARPRLDTAKQVMAPMAPVSASKVAAEATRADYEQTREAAFGGASHFPEKAPPRHMAIQINRALRDLMAKYPEMTLFGEDVAAKGGVYTVTTGLANTFRSNRVFNTLLDETTILGLAQGAGSMGLLPFPEIQYLAYVHNAADQIRGEACSLQFFSNGHFANPMVIRIASLGYQKGFGGHFHNDNSFAALRDIPGLVIACPSRGDDAAGMLRTCAALARVDGRVVAFLEPIALYMTKDLFEPKDGKWCFDYPPPDTAVALGSGRLYQPRAQDLTIVTYGNGVRFALQTAAALKKESGARVRVLDLRWLKPLNEKLIAKHAAATGKVLVIDEGRRTGGIAEQIFTVIDEHCGPEVRKARVCGEDSYIPLGDAANLVLPSEADILAAARDLL